jgi:hypothetical protein
VQEERAISGKDAIRFLQPGRHECNEVVELVDILRRVQTQYGVPGSGESTSLTVLFARHRNAIPLLNLLRIEGRINIDEPARPGRNFFEELEIVAEEDLPSRRGQRRLELNWVGCHGSSLGQPVRKHDVYMGFLKGFLKLRKNLLQLLIVNTAIYVEHLRECRESQLECSVAVRDSIIYAAITVAR